MINDFAFHHLDWDDPEMLPCYLLAIAALLLIWWVMDTLEATKRDE